MKNKLVIEFGGFPCSLDEGKTTDHNILLRMIGEVTVSRDRFRCVFVVFLYVTKVLSELVA